MMVSQVSALRHGILKAFLNSSGEIGKIAGLDPMVKVTQIANYGNGMRKKQCATR